MKKVIITAVIVAVCAACGGSSSVDKAISQVEKAIEKVEKNKGKMTDDEWNALKREVEEPLKVISDALEKNQVGLTAKIKIATVSAKWGAALAGAGLREIEKNKDEWSKELEKQGVNMDELNKELEKAAKELEKARQQLK